MLNSIKNPWITPAIKKSIKTKNKMYKRYVKHPITHANTYKLYRNNLTKIIKHAKNNYYQQRFNQCDGDMRQTWKQINNILGNNHMNKNAIFKVKDTNVHDETVIANAFNDFYANVGVNTANKLPNSNRDFQSFLPQEHYPNIVWNPTSDLEIKNIIKKVKSVKRAPIKYPFKSSKIT